MKGFILLFLFAAICFAECATNEMNVTIARQYGHSGAEKETFTIGKPDYNEDGEQIIDYFFTLQGSSDSNGKLVVKSFCLVPGTTYRLKVSSTVNGWFVGSYVLLYFEGYRIKRYTLGKTSKSETVDLWLFKPLHVFTQSITWSYTDVLQTNKDWTRKDFTSDGWSSAKIGSFSSFTAPTRYYRYQGSLSKDVLSYPSVLTTIGTKYGFILYVEGREVYKYNMPYTPIDPTTPAVTEMDLHSVTVAANKFLYPAKGKQYVVAIEVHLTAEALNESVADPFYCYSYFSTSDNNQDDGSYSGSVFYNGIAYSTLPGEGNYAVDKLFDEDTNSYYQTDSNSTIITYTFNSGSAYCINYYSVTATATGRGDASPKDWKVYGSNDGLFWDLLDERNDVIFEYDYDVKSFSLRDNVKVYNQYKMDISASMAENEIAFTEWSGHSAMYGSTILPTRVEYPVASYTLVKGYDVLDVKPYCNRNEVGYKVSKNLPSGLAFDENDGSIKGTPTVTSDATEYVITASNAAGNVDINLNIEVVDPVCTGDDDVPLLFSRVDYDERFHQCFTLISTVNNATYFSDCPDNNWYNSTRGLQTFYKCVPRGTYELHLTSLRPDDIEESAGGWMKESYLEINVPQEDDSNKLIGQFTYTQLCALDGEEYELENVDFINVGPIECTDGQIMVIDHQKIDNDVLEGFDLYKVGAERDEYIQSFYGHRHSYSVALCLPPEKYKLVLRKRSLYNDGSCTTCDGWSYENESNYSFVKIALPEGTSFDLLAGTSLTYVSEGEKFAVYDNSRTHTHIKPYHIGIPSTDIYNDTDCHYTLFFNLKYLWPNEKYFDSGMEVSLNTETCIEGIRKVGPCTSNGVLREGIVSVTKTDDNCNGAYVKFTQGSYDPYLCMFDQQEFKIYVKPDVSIVDASDRFNEACSGNQATENVNVFNPLTSSIETIQLKTDCHISNGSENQISVVQPPSGHSFIKVTFSVEAKDQSNPEINFIPTDLLFRESFEHVISEVSVVPVQDVHVVDIRNNMITIVADTSAEYYDDFADQFNGNNDQQTIIGTINTELSNAYPTFWSLYTVDLLYGSSIAELHSIGKCEATTKEVNFAYYSGSEQKNTKITVNFGETENMRYGSVALPTIEEGITFMGSVTSYCKFEYFKAQYNEIITTSVIQTSKMQKYSALFEITIQDIEDSGMNFGFRYAVARALTTLFQNNASAEFVIEDVFVYSFGSGSAALDTTFNVEVVLKSSDQLTAFKTYYEGLIGINESMKDEPKEIFLQALEKNLENIFKDSYGYRVVSLSTPLIEVRPDSN